MGADYIPEPDLKAAQWMRTFARLLAAHPSTYMISQADADRIGQATQEFRDALSVALRPGTRTSVSVEIKDRARASAQELCRRVAQRIKVNRDISDADKLLIGVPPINTPRRRRIPRPDTPPFLHHRATRGRRHVLAYSDASSNRRAKPNGVIQLQLVRVIGEQRAHDASQAVPCAICTKTPFLVPLDPADDGKIVTYFGRWVSRRGETGPWSPPLSLRVAA